MCLDVTATGLMIRLPRLYIDCLQSATNDNQIQPLTLEAPSRHTGKTKHVQTFTGNDITYPATQ